MLFSYKQFAIKSQQVGINTSLLCSNSKHETNWLISCGLCKLLGKLLRQVFRYRSQIKPRKFQIQKYRLAVLDLQSQNPHSTPHIPIHTYKLNKHKMSGRTVGHLHKMTYLFTLPCPCGSLSLNFFCTSWKWVRHFSLRIDSSSSISSRDWVDACERRLDTRDITSSLLPI